MSKGGGADLKSFLPFGTPWQMDGALRERAIQEREVFRSWVAELDASAGQLRVLTDRAAGPVCLEDSWFRNRAGGLPDAA